MEYTLLKVSGGICHFARVQVVAEVARDFFGIAEAIHLPLDINQCEVDRQIEPEWIEAALIGCQQAWEFLIERGFRLAGLLVLTRVVGTALDTRAEDVRIAAFMATWNTFTQGNTPLSLEWIDDVWKVRYL